MQSSGKVHVRPAIDLISNFPSQEGMRRREWEQIFSISDAVGCDTKVDCLLRNQLPVIDRGKFGKASHITLLTFWPGLFAGLLTVALIRLFTTVSDTKGFAVEPR